MLRRLLLVLVLLTVAIPASAKEPSAEKLKAQGDDHMRAKEHTAALEAYEAAFAKSKNPVLFFNRGRAYQFLARYPEALENLRRFAAEAPAAQRRRVPKLRGLIAEVAAKVAKLEVSCETPGARVLVRGTQVGETPLSGSIAVNAGEAEIEVLHPEHEPFRKTVALDGGEALTELEVELVPKSKLGTLAVMTEQKNVDLEVDGKPRGSAPTTIELTPGPHRVAASAPGYDDFSAEVEILPRRETELRIDLDATTPFYASWWFWTSVGVVVAGSTVTAILLTTEAPPPEGNFDPGLVVTRW